MIDMDVVDIPVYDGRQNASPADNGSGGIANIE